ncbi:MAG: AbgT family transporter [Gammaproteobacteria bacterium]|nr:AbgT family transporter [Gammaproteobacteria bacterium]
MRKKPAAQPNEARITRFLHVVEWLGNALPHPVSLFALFAIGVVLLSGILGFFEVSVVDPRPVGAKGRADNGLIEVVSLMNAEGLRMIMLNLVRNFVEFAPLGTVLVALLGVGVAERSGWLTAVIRSMVLNARPALVTVIIVFAGVLSNTASEMGYVVLVPLAAVVFYSLGRHPLAGLAAAFAGVSGGYSANLLIGTVDPLLSGITTEAARLIDPSYEVDVSANWYFMIASTFLITAVGSFISIAIVEPSLGKYEGTPAGLDDEDSHRMDPLSAQEKKGLWRSLWATLIFAGVMSLLIVPEGAILRNQETGAVAGSPFLKGIVAIIFVYFLMVGIVYGRAVGTIKSDRDVINAMAHAMSTLGLYIALVFFAAQFVKFFGWTNLGSASAQWAVTAPIFVPMLMLLGYAPEVIQAAYRIGDSSTNIITPMMSYFGFIMAFVAKYEPKAGVGTLIAMMLPYSVAFIVLWSVFFFLWTFVIGLPVGPASPTYYNVG